MTDIAHFPRPGQNYPYVESEVEFNLFLFFWNILLYSSQDNKREKTKSCEGVNRGAVNTSLSNGHASVRDFNFNFVIC